MKTFIPVNLNNNIRFKPTKKGEQILAETQPWVLERKNELGYCEMQIWCFAELFGPYFYNGCDTPVELDVGIQKNY
jgi:hypothetical protein